MFGGEKEGENPHERFNLDGRDQNFPWCRYCGAPLAVQHRYKWGSRYFCFKCGAEMEEVRYEESEEDEEC